MDGLAMLVQDTLKKYAFSGHLFAFRGKRARIIKILFWDGNGLRSGRVRVTADGRTRRQYHLVSSAARDAD